MNSLEWTSDLIGDARLARESALPTDDRLTAFDWDPAIDSLRNVGPALIDGQSQDHSEYCDHTTTLETLRTQMIPIATPNNSATEV